MCVVGIPQPGQQSPELVEEEERGECFGVPPPTEAALDLPLVEEGWWGRSQVTQAHLWADVSEQTPPVERENIHLATAVRHFYCLFKH